MYETTIALILYVSFNLILISFLCTIRDGFSNEILFIILRTVQFMAYKCVFNTTFQLNI